jgi:hypothetical protein
MVAAEQEAAAPIVFITARNDASGDGGGELAEDGAAFAVSVRSSSASKFEVNAVRLDDHGGGGWQHELYVNYLTLPHPAAASASSSSAAAAAASAGGGSGGEQPSSGAESELKTAGGSVVARYGTVPIVASLHGGATTTVWVAFRERFEQPPAAIVLTVQAAGAEAAGDEQKNEVFTAVLGPNATSVAGFAATVGRTDGTGEKRWSQTVQLNWLALAAAA